MEKGFIDELIEVNKRIPRRLEMNKEGELVTSKGKAVQVKFLRADLIRAYCPRDMDKFLFQLGKEEYRGMRAISREGANLALGYDFKTAENDTDIQVMLRACETSANAYYLGINYKFPEEDITPVVYFHINPKVQRALAINPEDEEFAGLIQKLKTQSDK